MWSNLANISSSSVYALTAGGYTSTPSEVRIMCALMSETWDEAPVLIKISKRAQVLPPSLAQTEINSRQNGIVTNADTVGDVKKHRRTGRVIYSYICLMTYGIWLPVWVKQEDAFGKKGTAVYTYYHLNAACALHVLLRTTSDNSKAATAIEGWVRTLVSVPGAARGAASAHSLPGGNILCR